MRMAFGHSEKTRKIDGGGLRVSVLTVLFFFVLLFCVVSAKNEKERIFFCLLVFFFFASHSSSFSVNVAAPVLPLPPLLVFHV